MDRPHKGLRVQRIEPQPGAVAAVLTSEIASSSAARFDVAVQRWTKGVLAAAEPRSAAAQPRSAAAQPRSAGEPRSRGCTTQISSGRRQIDSRTMQIDGGTMQIRSCTGGSATAAERGSATAQHCQESKAVFLRRVRRRGRRSEIASRSLTTRMRALVRRLPSMFCSASAGIGAAIGSVKAGQDLGERRLSGLGFAHRRFSARLHESEGRCEWCRSYSGDPTGEEAMPCGSSADFLCDTCGFLCLFCLEVAHSGCKDMSEIPGPSEHRIEYVRADSALPEDCSHEQVSAEASMVTDC
jgi:hypothetical protein